MAFDIAMLRVMAITNEPARGQNPDSLIPNVLAAVRGGATSIQVRLKGVSPRDIVAVTRAIVQSVNVPVLVNDRYDLALAAGAAGVHVGADDISVDDVRRCTPLGFIIGTSVGCDSEIANARNADYVGIGNVFATPSKDDAGQALGIEEFQRLLRATAKPTVAIGGITPQRVQMLREAGADGIAAIGAIFGATDVEAAARALALASDPFATFPL